MAFSTPPLSLSCGSVRKVPAGADSIIYAAFNWLDSCRPVNNEWAAYVRVRSVESSGTLLKRVASHASLARQYVARDSLRQDRTSRRRAAHLKRLDTDKRDRTPHGSQCSCHHGGVHAMVGQPGLGGGPAPADPARPPAVCHPCFLRSSSR